MLTVESHCLRVNTLLLLIRHLANANFFKHVLSIVLTEEEVAELTRVRARTHRLRYERQQQELIHMGIPFLVRPDEPR